MPKIITLSTGYLGEEYTFKCALNHYIKAEHDVIKKLKATYGNKALIPELSVHLANIRNSKETLKRL